MKKCTYCEKGVSDYNGRIVCKDKYIYPSFQDYSYNMFNNNESEYIKTSVNIESENFKLKRIFYGVLLILIVVFFFLIR